VAASNGIGEVLLSLTHDGEYAGAVVAALSDKARPLRSPESRS
jgi:phosphopantetheinyl transferase (holo-ACP synthase)